MEGIYKINLIPNDLSNEETILQIADTLDNLNGIVEDVFTRVLERIKRNMELTSKLKERIETSRSKVDKLTGMQKAIKVFSSAKYPASIKHEHYQSVFGLDGYQHEPKKVVLRGKTQGQSNDKGIQEKLHFYHVKAAQFKNTKPRKDFDLNAVVGNISTVGELLIFNTDESPYLSAASRPAYVPIVTPNVENKSLLDAAPSSFLRRDVLKREVDEYLYAPGMGMVPELEMPLDLPCLPGIAGDLQFSMATDGSIAPSAVTSPVSLPPPLDPLPVAELPDLKELEVKLPDVKMPDIPDAPPPPPVVVHLPPPPPPPPPPMSFTTTKREEKPQAGPAAAPAADDRSNLMAAIRQAGGAERAKLRSAAAPTTTQPGSKPGGGDLMADLHAKLSMRRRGISGAERAGRGDTVLHTLAAVIPEPGDSSPQRSSSDDDWE